MITIEGIALTDVCEVIFMKIKLMILSLSPLALLTIIRNFLFVTTNEAGIALRMSDFILENIILLLVLISCLIWTFLAIVFYISFCAFKWADKKSGYEVKLVEDKEDASLNFFLTLIIPLLVDDVGSIQGALTFVAIVILICLLLYRTSLFYANPILTLLGYRVYTFKFLNNSEFRNQECIGLSQGIIEESSSIEYKKITDKVLYVRRMKNDN